MLPCILDGNAKDQRTTRKGSIKPLIIAEMQNPALHAHKTNNITSLARVDIVIGKV